MSDKLGSWCDRPWRWAVVAALCVGLVGFPSRSAAIAPTTACDLTAPAACSLAELGALGGLRVGSTLEASEIASLSYSTTLASEFNAMTPENALKLYSIQAQRGQWDFAAADAVVDFAVAHSLAIRGHTLVWAQDAFTPSWTRAITDPVELRSVVNEYIQVVMTRYAGKIHRYDVVNEPLQTLGGGPSQSVFWQLGPDWIGDVFRYAHSVDPTAELWLNETATDWLPQKHEELLALVRSLLVDGVPLHGVGIQTHRVPNLAIDPQEMRAQLQDFADLGLDVAITELDIPVDPAQSDALTWQAAEWAKVIDACAAVTGCVEVTTWGITDASTWLDTSSPWPKPTRPLLFDDVFAPKPAYYAARDALARAAVARQASPQKFVDAMWSTEDSARIDAIARHLGVTPGQVQKLAVYLLTFLSASLPPGPIDVVLPTRGTDISLTTRWGADEVHVIDGSNAKFGLDDSSTTRLAVYLLSYLLALSGT